MKPIIKIWMDDRERSNHVLEELKAMDDVDVHIRRLALGDYNVSDILLVERKTFYDFAISIIDGRLFRQISRLSSSPLKSVLILEGRSEDIQCTEVRREAMQGALITTSLVFGIPVLRSFGPGETARLMVYAARQFKADAMGGRRRAGYRPKGKRKRQLFVLQGLPGIGPRLAECLLDHYGSIQAVLNASMESLLSVNGIGKETAKNIISMVREPDVVYGARSGLMTTQKTTIYSHDGISSTICRGNSMFE